MSGSVDVYALSPQCSANKRGPPHARTQAQADKWQLMNVRMHHDAVLMNVRLHHNAVPINGSGHTDASMGQGDGAGLHHRHAHHHAKGLKGVFVRHFAAQVPFYACVVMWPYPYLCVRV